MADEFEMSAQIDSIVKLFQMSDSNSKVRLEDNTPYRISATESNRKPCQMPDHILKQHQRKQAAMGYGKKNSRKKNSLIFSIYN